MDYFKLLHKELKDGNEVLLERFKNNGCNMFSVELLSISFADFLIEDLEFILSNYSSTGNPRFASIIFRSMVEQVALYGFLVKFPEYIEDYFSGSEEDIKLRYKGNNLIKELKKTTEARWSKPSVRKMCIELGEVVSNDEKLSLYDIYCVSSDSIHDSYYEEIGRIMQSLDEESSDESYDYEMTLLVLSLNVFRQIYLKVLDS